jgi:hypothetical protein
MTTGTYTPKEIHELAAKVKEYEALKQAVMRAIESFKKEASHV